MSIGTKNCRLLPLIFNAIAWLITPTDGIEITNSLVAPLVRRIVPVYSTDAGRVALATYVRGASQSAEQLGHLLVKAEALVLASLHDDEEHGEIDAGLFDGHTLVTRWTS